MKTRRLISISGRFSVLSMNIDESKCVSCKKCKEVCPAEAVIVSDGKPSIDKKYGLLCHKCSDACPIDVISYKKTS